MTVVVSRSAVFESSIHSLSRNICNSTTLPLRKGKSLRSYAKRLKVPLKNTLRTENGLLTHFPNCIFLLLGLLQSLLHYPDFPRHLRRLLIRLICLCSDIRKYSVGFLTRHWVHIVWQWKKRPFVPQIRCTRGGWAFLRWLWHLPLRHQRREMCLVLTVARTTFGCTW